jgi:protein-S-isoprenylcysteine O-methyltransferase Ste14
VSIFAFGVASYATFFATFLYAIGFVGNFGVPRTIDGPLQGSLAAAILINLGLLGLFAVQHSVMARQGFKRWLTRFVPEPAERSTYVLASSAALLLLFWQWQPMGGVVWNFESSAARGLAYGIFALGWATILFCTFLINHFDLFGLRQVWLALLDRPYTPVALHHAEPVSRRPSPALCRVAARLLGDADHDRDAPALRRGDDGVHPDRDPARGARPGTRARRVVPRLSASRSHADPQRAATRGAGSGAAQRLIAPCSARRAQSVPTACRRPRSGRLARGHRASSRSLSAGANARWQGWTYLPGGDRDEAVEGGRNTLKRLLHIIAVFVLAVSAGTAAVAVSTPVRRRL